jgi:hypothetical protein
MRLTLICAALCLASAAHASGDPYQWPAYQDTESIVTLAPMGAWIDDSTPDAPRVVVACPPAEDSE